MVWKVLWSLGACVLGTALFVMKVLLGRAEEGLYLPYLSGRHSELPREMFELRFVSLNTGMEMRGRVHGVKSRARVMGKLEEGAGALEGRRCKQGVCTALGAEGVVGLWEDGLEGQARGRPWSSHGPRPEESGWRLWVSLCLPPPRGCGGE